MRFFIAGGGCYGNFYVTQLLQAHARGKIQVEKIYVVDRVFPNQVSQKFHTEPRVESLNFSWENFGDYVSAHAAELTEAHWVPTPIGPHIIYHWIRERLKAHGFLLQKVKPILPILPLPYFQWLDSTLILSHAPGVCPTTCVEPKICPLTKSDRDWEMRDTLKSLPVPVYSFVCQHFAHAVGTIPFSSILANFQAIEENLNKGMPTFGVATTSSCHGIVDFLALA